MSEENVGLTRKGIDALNSDGVEGVIPFCDPEIEWIAMRGFLPDAQDYHGHDGVRAWFAKVGDTLKDMRWEAEEISDYGDRLVVALRLTARGRGSGIPADFLLYLVWTVRDGKLLRLESYLSRDEAMEAAGVRG